MEYGNLLELIKTVSESNLSSFQYEDGATKIHMSSVDSVVETENDRRSLASEMKEDKSSVSDCVEGIEKKAEKNVEYKNIVKSPLVGTFYVAPSEDSEPFVAVGDSVKSGQVLAIVEAMKLMNDIESDYDGIVQHVFVENGQTVEYGQPLFAIG